ncbi:phosphonate ABC transporter ATP-binding protein [Brevibacterium daeguense]|uniref:Phosphonate ABC transporter ATP-binding protein n=1 Tax=Brevibacterium daeguense TaxID=909936 RepID=A0ABP8EHC0_9MICO|nr:phosphonate ABC transporter ATP-binding protein [Brevibacterium daeguense]
MSAAVQLEDLKMRFRNGHQALDGVDLTVEPGQLLALTGSNGAGKSTLLRCMVRLQEPTSGMVRIHEAEVTGASSRALRRIRQDVGFIFQNFNLVDRVSAFRNVTNGAIARHGSQCAVPALVPSRVRREAMDCLERVGLAHLADRRVDTLSGGQRQRVAIARSLMQRPRLILADEPVASLDPAAGTAVMELLRDISAERGITVIAALHQVDFALDYSERIIGLRAGRVELDESNDRLSAERLHELYGPAPLTDSGTRGQRR